MTSVRGTVRRRPGGKGWGSGHEARLQRAFSLPLCPPSAVLPITRRSGTLLTLYFSSGFVHSKSVWVTGAVNLPPAHVVPSGACRVLLSHTRCVLCPKPHRRRVSLPFGALPRVPSTVVTCHFVSDSSPALV